MKIELDPNETRRFADAAQAAGRDPALLLSQFMRRFVAHHGSEDTSRELAAQASAWDAFLEEVDALPDSDSSGGGSGTVDHDETLYGGPGAAQTGGFPERNS